MILRHLAGVVRDSLGFSRVVLLTGARQVGKSTLAMALAGGAWPARYVTLDDRASLDRALADPDGFLQGLPRPLVVDEVQRAPDLLRAVKVIVDRDRRAGQFLLTGSANVLALRTVTETLAGRMVLHTLHPFSWAERLRRPRPEVLAALFQARRARDVVRIFSAPGRGPAGALREAILRGGFPMPSLMRSAAHRSRWFDGYVRTYVERDVRDVAAIERVPEFHRLLQALAWRSGQLLNLSDLSRELGIPYITARRYVALLEATYQAFLLPPYFVNVGKRLVRAPKVFLGDSGLAAHLLGAADWPAIERLGRAGALLETWVAAELRKLVAVEPLPVGLYFWRPQAGREVDFLLERAGRLVAIEVRATRRLAAADLAGLRDCASLLKGRLGLRVVVYAGEEVVPVDALTVAVPLARFFGAS